MQLIDIATQRDLQIKNLAWRIFQADTLQSSQSNELLKFSEYVYQITQENSNMYSKVLSSSLLEKGDLTGALSSIENEIGLATWSWIVSNFIDTSAMSTIKDSTLLDQLWFYAQDYSNSENGVAWGILQEQGLTYNEPTPIFPIEYRASYDKRSEQLFSSPFFLKMAPNPSNGATFITYPLEAENEGYIKVYDPTGRLVQSTKLQNNGFLELDLKNFSNGIYLVQLEIFNKVVETQKLSIIK
jgi:hypothetical protein